MNIPLELLHPLLATVLAYLIGSVSFAVVVSRVMGLSDPRSYGSHNPGATNVLRSGNKLAALLTLLLDGVKGWLPVYAVVHGGAAYGLGQGTEAMVALAAFVRRKSRERAANLSGQLPGYDVQIGHDYSVVVLGAKGENRYIDVHVDEFRGQSGKAIIKVSENHYIIESHSRLNDVRISGTVNGKPFTAQVERGTPKNPLALQIQHNGTRIEALVVSPRMAELHKMMPFKTPPDMSRFVLSPMPGLLVNVAVTPGQKIQAGERVAVIEAMKMENILFAAHDGVVKKVMASQGESLSVDQVIVEFEA